MNTILIELSRLGEANPMFPAAAVFLPHAVPCFLLTQTSLAADARLPSIPHHASANSKGK